MHRSSAAALVAASFAVPAFGQQFQDQTATKFPSPNPAEYTNYVEAHDIDADGDLDLVFVNGGNFSSAGSPQAVRIWINDGAGTFTDDSAARIGLSGNYRGVAFGDADGDGDDDMLLAEDFNRQPKLYMNDGTGHFSDGTAARLPAMTLSSTRGQFGDLDGDGDLDIYINNGGTSNRFGCGQNRVWINDGTGHYADETAARHPLGNVCQPMDVILGDVDGDLDLDVRTANRGTNVSKLYLNDGNGVFTDASGNVPGDSNCYSYDFGDMDGDGDLDMLGANGGSSNRELLLANNGLGVFIDVSSRLSPNTTGDDNDSKYFDLDDDGDMDIVIAALFQSREKVYVNNGAGLFTLDSTRISSNNDASLDIAVADLDGDGDFDIVTAQGESGAFQNRIYVNTTGPADSRAPRFSQVEALADTLDETGPYPVRAMILDDVSADRGFYARSVELRWTVDGGSEQSVAMRWVGNSMWRGEIPGVGGGGLVAYHVVAKDWADNVGTSATRQFQVGNPLGDVNGDGLVNFSDLVQVLAAWGPCKACPEDVDGDGTVGFADLIIVLANWS